MGSTNGTERCLGALTIDDTLVEGDETFTVTLTLVTTGVGVTTGNTMTTVTITENGGSYL